MLDENECARHCDVSPRIDRRSGSCVKRVERFQSIERFERNTLFLERMKTPELAAEITVQPIRRFGMDAAVIFSDILIIPEAMGQTLDFTPAPILSPTLPGDLTLRPVDPQRDFPWLGETIRRVRDELGDHQAILGFTGAPWTLACYMVERGSKKDSRVSKSGCIGSLRPFGR